LVVDGDLNLFNSQIKSLPQGVKIGGELGLTFTKLETLPKGLIVKGGLDIAGTPLEKYSDDELRRMVKPGVIKGPIIRN
jgi:hypothetical protein